MARPVNRTTREKKDTILAYIRKGIPLAKALSDLGITKQAVQYYKSSDKSFREEYARLSNMESASAFDKRVGVPDFPEFCEEYLDTKLFKHQLQWYDVLEGRRPRDLHENQI